MRTTKMKIKPKIELAIEQLVDENVMVEDITLSNDFAKDLYALFEEEFNKFGQFRGFWNMFMELKGLYVLFHIKSLSENLTFYRKIQKFFKYLLDTKLFRELDKYESLEAVRIFIEMFKNKQPQQGQGNKKQEEDQKQEGNGEQSKGGKQGESSKEEKDQNNKGNGKDNGEKNESEKEEQENSSEKSKQNEKQSGKKGKGQSNSTEGEQGQEQSGESKGEGESQSERRNNQDQHGLSANEKNLPIDMKDFKENIEKIEDFMKAGLFDKEDMTEFVGKTAGTGHKEMHIGNIKEIIKKAEHFLTKQKLDIFKVARKHEELEVYSKTEELINNIVPDNEMDIRYMESHNEALKLLPTQYALPDEEFDVKLAKNELLVRNYQTRKLKKQALYLLVDVSGSMSDGWNGGDCSAYASGVALSLVRQAVREGSIYFLRFFDYVPFNLYRITNQEEANKMCDILLRQPYSGGGTNIDRAIRQAIEDINKDRVTFEKVEIMLITDGSDNVYITKKDLGKIKLHTTIINGNNRSLEEISTTYTRLNTKDIQGYA
jgi:hypothetical protein